MSSNVTRYAILYSTPEGHAFELREERLWNEGVFATLSRVLVAKVTWEGSLVLSEPLALAGLPDPPEKASWTLLGFVRSSAWRLLVLADQVERVGGKSAANILRRQAVWLPFSIGEQPAVIADEDALSFRTAARSMRSYMIWAVKFARLEHVLAFWAAGKIVRGELLLRRLKGLAAQVGTHDKMLGQVLTNLVYQMALGDSAWITYKIAWVRKSTFGKKRSAWRNMIDALPREAQVLVHDLVRGLDTYAFQARLQ